MPWNSTGRWRIVVEKCEMSGVPASCKMKSSDTGHRLPTFSSTLDLFTFFAFSSLSCFHAFITIYAILQIQFIHTGTSKFVNGVGSGAVAAILSCKSTLLATLTRSQMRLAVLTFSRQEYADTVPVVSVQQRYIPPTETVTRCVVPHHAVLLHSGSLVFAGSSSYYSGLLSLAPSSKLRTSLYTSTQHLYTA